MTGCQCEKAGWCERHQMTKTATWFHLCQHDEKYWKAWEAGTGPGQNIGKSQKMPPIKVQAWNLATSIADFVKSGFKLLSEEEYTKRMTICDTCEYRVNKRCRLCGCSLPFKVRGESFKCPAGKWNV